MDRRSFTLAALLAFLAVASLGQAGIGTWTKDGTPYMCYDVTDIALGRAPGSQYPTVYAADTVWNMSLFKTEDEAESWIAVQFPSYGPYAVTCEALNPKTLYIGVPGPIQETNTGVYKSSDGGVAWGRVVQGLTSGYVYTLTIDPNNNQVIWAGNYSTTTDPGHIFKSTDGGSSWSDKLPGVYNVVTWKVVVDPTNSQVLYVARHYPPYGDPLIKSTDGGVNWVSASSGIQGHSLRSLAISASNPQVLYAGGSGQLNGYGIYKTTNGGGSWTLVQGLPSTLSCYSLVIHPSDANIAFAATSEGQYRTMDGTNWYPINNGLPGFQGYDWEGHSLAYDPPSPGRPQGVLYLGTRMAFYRSTNLGDLWEEKTNQMHVPNIWALALHLPTILTKAQGSFAPIHASSDAGRTWSLRQPLDGESLWETDIVFHPVLSNLALAVTSDWTGQMCHAFRSANGGLSWYHSSIIGNLGWAYTLAPEPVAGELLPVYVGGEPLDGTHFWPLRVSQDFGTTWSAADWPPLNWTKTGVWKLSIWS